MDQDIKTNNEDLIAYLDSTILEKTNEIKLSIDYWIREIHSGSDPLSPIISDKGIWILQSPLTNTKSLIKTSMRVFANDLAQKSNGLYRVSEVELSKKELNVSIYNGNKKILTWSLFDSVLEIPVYEEAIKIRLLISKKEKELIEHNREMREVAAILKNPDAMVANGYYVLFLRSFFRRKKHKQEINEIKQELKTTKLKLEHELDVLKQEFEKLKSDDEVKKCLKFLDIHYYKFPRIRSLSNYENGYRKNTEN